MSGNLFRINGIRKTFLSFNHLFGWLGICLMIYTAVINVAFLHHHQNNSEIFAASVHHETLPATATLSSDEDAIAFSLAHSSETSQVPEQKSDSPSHNCGDCICASLHVLLCHQPNFRQPRIVFHRQSHTFLLKFRHSESHLQSLFHPPRTA